MRILFVSSEIEPLAKVGGLADVVSALPSRLKELGCDTRVVIPYYRCVKENVKNLKLKLSQSARTIHVNLSGRMITSRVLETEHDNVKIYMLACDELYERDQIYSGPGGDYEDNDIRFGFLSLGTLEMCKSLQFRPDIFHCHDWHTALIPICLKHGVYKNDSYFCNSKTIFSSA